MAVILLVFFILFHHERFYLTKKWLPLNEEEFEATFY